MDENDYRTIGYEDDNARDAFSAADFFKTQIDKQHMISGIPLVNKQSFALRDVTNIPQESNNDDENTFGLRELKKIKSRNSSGKFLDLKNLVKVINQSSIPSNNINSGIGLKRKPTEFLTNDESQEFPKYEIPHKKSFELNMLALHHLKTEIINDDNNEKISNMDFSDSDSESDSISQAFTTPANGYNDAYQKYVVVGEPSINSHIIKVTEHTPVWNQMINSSYIEKRVLITSPRTFCSPKEQFVVTDKNQYKSQCLIHRFYSDRPNPDFVYKAFIKEDIEKHKRALNTLLTKNINTIHFHDLYLEKLPCNRPFDFMPTSSKLTGQILSSFVNYIFKMSNFIEMSDEVIHIAVDYIYQYLSRINDVPLCDMHWVTIGAVLVAFKYEGHTNFIDFVNFANCKSRHLRKAELRLMNVIDCNFSKPDAFSFRNRFLLIESCKTGIVHLSSFILDMCLHSYTLMLLPASRRAAAAMWLARLIDTFEDIRPNDENTWNIEIAKKKLENVWPASYEKLTGYLHSDVSKLALTMHVIIITFISKGTPQYPSVRACYKKYSSDKIYGQLTQSYEKFTARIVYEASELYCRVNDLDLSSWMEKNEYETMMDNLTENKVKTFRRSVSCVEPVIHNHISGNSCPEKLTLRHIYSNVSNNSSVSNSSYKYLKTFDSGYSTSSNMEHQI